MDCKILAFFLTFQFYNIITKSLLPQCVFVTDGKTHDQKAVQDLHFEPGDLLVFDRAYLDYAWLYRLHQGGVWFVTRFKTNSCYEVVQTQAASGPVLANQIIRLLPRASTPRPLPIPGNRQGICLSNHRRGDTTL